MNYVCGFWDVNKIHCWVLNRQINKKNCAVCRITEVKIVVKEG